MSNTFFRSLISPQRFFTPTVFGSPPHSHFNYFVCPAQYLLRNCQADLFRRLEIDNKRILSIPSTGNSLV